jgi:hypothetical protein
MDRFTGGGRTAMIGANVAPGHLFSARADKPKAGGRGKFGHSGLCKNFYIAMSELTRKPRIQDE